MSHFDYKPIYCRNLPHIQPPGATFFVTFHLAGSLPQSVLQAWRAEKNQLEAEISRHLKLHIDSRLGAAEQLAFAQKRKYREWRRHWFQKFESMLDAAQDGPVWLKDDRVAKGVAESLRYRDGKVYRLDAYCIMATHVHVVFAPLAQPSEMDTVGLQDDMAHPDSLGYIPLSSIMQSLKGYTAWKANRLLGRSGAFWHHESYDHSVRNVSDWRRVMTYVLNNPVKAGLVDAWEDWRWSYYRPGFLP